MLEVKHGANGLNIRRHTIPLFANDPEQHPKQREHEKLLNTK